MKKIIALLFIALATSARAQTQPFAFIFVDTSTPHVVGGNTIVGDSLPVAFGKMNTNWLTLSNAFLVIVTNGGSGYTLAGSFGGSFTGGGTGLLLTNPFITNCIITNGIVMGVTITNSALTNSYFFKGLVSNSIIAGATFRDGLVTNAVLTNNIFAGTNLSPFTVKAATQRLIVTPGSNDEDGGSPEVEFTTSTNGSGADRGGMQFEGYSDATFPTPICFVGHGYDPNGNSIRFTADGSCRFDMTSGKFSSSPADFGIDQPGSVNGGFYYQSSSASVGIGQPSPAYNLDITGSFGDSSDGTYSMDSGGNMICTMLTQTSDRTLKEKIKPIAPGASLAQILLLTNYEWNFRARTNLISHISAVTNSVAKTVLLTTNQVSKIIPAGEKQIGPMAQDWKAVTGLGDGRHISATALNGLLLGGIQDLAVRQSVDEQYLRIPLYTPPTSVSTTFGYGAGLVTCDATNLYFSVGTNSWRRITLDSQRW